MADDDDKELKDQRVVTMMTPSELESIDDWMFKHRIRSRGEAIRRLCQVGLSADEHFAAMVESHIAVAMAAMDLATKMHAEEDAMKVLDGVSAFWQNFGKLRSVALPMRRNVAIDEAFNELNEIREAWAHHDPEASKKLNKALLAVAREAAARDKG